MNVSTELKQGKIVEFNDLLQQRETALKKQIAGLNLTDYDQQLINAPHETWRLISQMLQAGEIDESIFDHFLNFPERYLLDNNQIILNTDWEETLTEKRRQVFLQNFIHTPLGWYRKQPKGYANAAQSLDIIFNMVNALGSFTKEIAELMIFYPQPNFTKPEECTEAWLIQHQLNPEPCTKEEFLEFYIAFQKLWAQAQYKK